MEKAFSRVSVVGLGYIGLPTAAVLANRGLEVIGVDVVEDVIATINEGRIHIVEPALDVLVSAAVNSGNLRAVTVPESAEAFMIAVPTPFTAGHAPDLRYIRAAVTSIAPVLEKGNLVVLESTSPVGTTEQMTVWLRELRPDLTFPGPGVIRPDIHVAHCPERVLPGRVLQELVENDRVIGGMSEGCAARATELYKTFVRGECIATSARTAEMVKLTENASRDVSIAFSNELSMICAELDINVWELIELANRHPRVNILQPGTGVGGHCIAVDPWFIVHTSPEQARLIRMAREVNDSKPQFVLKKIEEKASRFHAPVIACLGVAFKPDIDDLRESPALGVVRYLAQDKAGTVLVVEPNVRARPKQLDDMDVEFVTLDEALERADILALLVKHTVFTKLEQHRIREKIVLDFVDALGQR